MRRDLQSMVSAVSPVNPPFASGATVLRASSDPQPPALAQPPHQLPFWALGGLGVGAGVVLGAAVWAAMHLQADPALRTGALFVHLIALVVSFGAVIAVDWFALLWLLGRRSLAELTRVSAAAHLPIWLGLLGLVLSGALLGPDVSEPLTWLKLSLVLLVALNGLRAFVIESRLAQFHAGIVPYQLLRQAVGAAALSQLGWWGATIIGFMNVQR